MSDVRRRTLRVTPGTTLSDNASVLTTAPVTALLALSSASDNAVPTAPVTALLALSSASDNASVPQSTDNRVSSQKDRRNKGKTIRKNAGPYDKENAVPSTTAASSSSSRVMAMVGIARSTPLTAGALAALSSGRSYNPPFAAVSRPARKAIAAARAGQLTVWQFTGVVKWNDGAIDGTPLTHAEAEVEARKAPLQSYKVDRAARLSHLRDSWSCILCGPIRYETIGRTSNLSKHVSKTFTRKSEFAASLMRAEIRDAACE
ncbi:hypothetical protein A4X06_0g7768 [Tilletia controversa]|uniref:Uncharacterized protein n=1 Tax=Tilletia controversa TaxID=13291 RepID=A0A8X7STN9_9BASI|nr:hypothetical protein A4X06_0g7768 [Tilletia controversa]